MTDWSEVLRPQLLDLGPYVPGPSLDDLKRKIGIDDVAKLNWNEGLFGPLPGVLDAVAGELSETWSYPEHAYLELREAIAAETGARPDQILPGHVGERRRATAAARDHLAAGLRAAGLEPLPSDANFLLVEHGADDDALADGLLRRGVLVRPGSELGLPGWARITVGPRPLMGQALEALPAVLAELSPARARAR